MSGVRGHVTGRPPRRTFNGFDRCLELPNTFDIHEWFFVDDSEHSVDQLRSTGWTRIGWAPARGCAEPRRLQCKDEGDGLLPDDDEDQELSIRGAGGSPSAVLADQIKSLDGRKAGRAQSGDFGGRTGGSCAPKFGRAKAPHRKAGLSKTTPFRSWSTNA